jgi:hypothetical protein
MRFNLGETAMSTIWAWAFWCGPLHVRYEWPIHTRAERIKADREAVNRRLSRQK